MNKKFLLLPIFVLGFFISQAQNADFTLKYNSSSSQYEVYVKADVDFPKFFVGGGSQISIVLPAEIEDQRLLVETVEGGPWLDNSQLYAPEACKTCDFHGIASNGSMISLKKGEEKLLFTFTVPTLDTEKSIRLFENKQDPQSNVKGMSGGDFNNYFACALTLKDAYRQNYENGKQLTGTIKTWNGFEVDLVNLSNGHVISKSDEDGKYQMELLSNQPYDIIPEKNERTENGLNTLDIIKIQQHILNIQQFNYPEQWVAADVNKSGTISASDIMEIRQVILGNHDNFQNNTSWRFINAAHQYNRETPLKGTLPEVVKIPQLAEDKNADFTAIKVGDVDGNATPNSTTIPESSNSNKVLTLKLADTQLKTGDTYTATFTTEEFSNLQGYQLSLQFESMTFEEIKSDLGSKNNFGLTQHKNGLISTSWNQTKTDLDKLPAKAALFQVTFKAERDGLLSEMLTLANNPTTVEAYDMERNTMDIALTFKAPLENKPFELFQNEPNPFKEQTKIGFYLPGDSEIELIFRDESGRILKTIKEDRKAGFNSFDFDKKDFQRGLIFYQLDSKFGSQNRKMLRLE